jgi:hypothetical protein
MEGATDVLFGGQGPHGRLRTYCNLRFLSKWEASEMPATRGKHPQESGGIIHGQITAPVQGREPCL